MLNIDDNRVALTISPILRLAFRPLFLGGALFSWLAIAWWSYFWTWPLNWQPYGGALWWHGHEMIFGFGSAIIAGFLLTAVQTWTGVIGLRGAPLALLAGTWLLGRLLLAFDTGLPPLLIAIVDCSFLLFSALAMAYPVIKVRQWKNLMFVPMLALMTLLNAESHYGALNHDPALAMRALHATILLITLIIAVVGGRVIPFFTANATDYTRKPNILLLDAISLLSILTLLAMAAFGFSEVSSFSLTVAAGVAAVSNAWRFFRWGIQASWHSPLLWSLHLAYLFLPLGMLALLLFSLDLVSLSIALHCFTVGAIGGMILAMISRVTLGHTGRPIHVLPRAVPIAFVALFVAVLCRVLLTVIFPGESRSLIAAAGVFWLLAFGIYLFNYGPMLVKVRADGRPG